MHTKTETHNKKDFTTQSLNNDFINYFSDFSTKNLNKTYIKSEFKVSKLEEEMRNTIFQDSN